MEIEEIRLKDFRCFYGESTISFSGDPEKRNDHLCREWCRENDLAQRAPVVLLRPDHRAF